MEDIKLAEEYFLIGQSDLEALAFLGMMSQDARETLIDGLYRTLSSWPEATSMFTQETLAKVKQAQAKYFDELFSGQMGQGYARRRRQIGAVHHEKKVSPLLYMAAYSLYLTSLRDWVLPLLLQKPLGLQRRVHNAITKVVLYDIALAWDEYNKVSEQRCDEVMRLLVSQQNLMISELKRLGESYRDSVAGIADRFHQIISSLPLVLPPRIVQDLEALEQYVQSLRDTFDNEESL